MSEYEVGERDNLLASMAWAGEEMERLKTENARLRNKEEEWDSVRQSALEIIRYDETMAKQSPYWRSMMLTMMQTFALDKEVIDEHIAFTVQHTEGEVTNISMSPKTEQGVKLIQVWGVMDMLGELIKGMDLQKAK
jgi:hypothetical protein